MSELSSQFLFLLTKWNRTHRLVGAPEQIREHWDDALTASPHLEAVDTLVDIGSGAGFPSIPLACEHPNIQVTAVEPNHKKWSFLQAAKRELKLDNFEALAIREEALPTPHQFDAATSRATFNLTTWLERGLRLVRPGGIVIGFEGGARTELPRGVQRFPNPGQTSRAVVVLRKPKPGL